MLGEWERTAKDYNRRGMDSRKIRKAKKAVETGGKNWECGRTGMLSRVSVAPLRKFFVCENNNFVVRFPGRASASVGISLNSNAPMSLFFSSARALSSFK